MRFLKNLFANNHPIRTYSDFWNWFKKQERTFFRTVRRGVHIEKAFLDQVSPKLAELNEGIGLLTGMYDDQTAELIFTIEGLVRNVFWVEDLVQHAPAIEGWKFTALTPPVDIQNCNIDMHGRSFNGANLFFYANDLPEYTDEIDLAIVYSGYEEKDADQIIHGCHIFLDNFLGELDFATKIDNIEVMGPQDATRELIPISKLKAYLNWREKEFQEKYDTFQAPENQTFTLFTAKDKEGNPAIAIINTALLDWGEKASHSWITIIEIMLSTEGLPDAETNQALVDWEEQLLRHLQPLEGHLHIGRQTTSGKRNIYFASREFRAFSKAVFEYIHFHKADMEISYRIFRDKYWQGFERFQKKL